MKRGPELGEQALPDCLNGRSFRQWKFPKHGNKETGRCPLLLKVWCVEPKGYLKKKETLGCGLLTKIFFWTSGCLWRNHRGP